MADCGDCMELGLELDSGIWSSGEEEDFATAALEPHYCYMATNAPGGKSIIEQVKSMISDNNFDLTLCESYLAQIDSDLKEALKSYHSVLKERDRF